LSSEDIAPVKNPGPACEILRRRNESAAGPLALRVEDHLAVLYARPLDSERAALSRVARDEPGKHSRGRWRRSRQTKACEQAIIYERVKIAARDSLDDHAGE